MTSTYWKTARVLPTILLAACGGGGGGGGTGVVSLAITDAPVDGVDQVWVEFQSIELKPKNGSAIRFDFDVPLSVDLKTLNGDNTEVLLDNEEVPAGEYSWIRLIVNADFDGVFDSYVMTDTSEQFEIRVPSGELKLVSGFTVVRARLTE